MECFVSHITSSPKKSHLGLEDSPSWPQEVGKSQAYWPWLNDWADWHVVYVGYLGCGHILGLPIGQDNYTPVLKVTPHCGLPP